MADAVFTLPLTPRENPSLFFYLTPFVADIWGKIEKKPVFILVNARGMKYSQKAIELFERHLHYLNIRRTKMYDSEYPLNELETACEFLFQKGSLIFDITNVMVCDCGGVECLPESISREDFRVIDNSVFPPRCKLCNGVLRRIQKEVLRLRIKDSYIPECIWPQQFPKELQDKAKLASNKLYLVSRLRASCPEIEFQGKKVRIDTDFTWMLFMAHLINSLNITSLSIPITHSVYHQLVLSSAVARELNPNLQVQFYLLPKVFLKNPTFQDEDLWSLNPLTLRFLLAFGLGRNRKEVLLESNIVHWTKITTELLLNMGWKDQNEKFVDIKEFSCFIQKYPLLKVLKDLRSTSPSFFSCRVVAAIF